MTASEKEKQLKSILYSLVPADGSPEGNITLLKKWHDTVKKNTGMRVTDTAYWETRNQLIVDGRLAKSRGKGGAVYRLETTGKRYQSVGLESIARKMISMIPSTITWPRFGPEMKE